MAKLQAFFALLAVAAAFAAPTGEVAPSEDQKTEEVAALAYSSPYYSEYYDSKLVSPYAYPAATHAYAAAPAVVSAPYVKYTPSVKVVASPTPYAYTRFDYKHVPAAVYPTGYSYSKVYGGW